MKKILTIALIAVLVVCALLLVACDKEGKKDDTTTPAQTTAAKTTKAKTTAEPTTAEPTTEAITTAFPKELKDVMPATLPDGKSFDVKYRMDMETNVDEWKVTGRSISSVKFEGVKGVYGQGVSFGLVDEEHADGTGTHRCEIGVEPEFAVNLKGVSGVLWWVDFTSTTPMEGKNGACASVTLQGNDYRSNKNGNLSVGYYYLDGQWVETKNVNACRMEIPHQFKGWIYVPATSYVKNSDKSAITGDDGNFLDFDVYNFNLYTDYYDQADPNTQIIFDEVMWIIAK